MSYYGTKNEDQCAIPASNVAYSGIAGDLLRTPASDAVEPVTLSEAKEYLRISLGEATFDSQITRLISSSRQEIEEWLNRSFIPQSIIVTMAVCNGRVIVPGYPVMGDIAVTDSDGAAITNGNYQSTRGVYKIDGYDEITMTYNAGYDAVPDVFKDGILRLVAWNWENRGDSEAKPNLAAITGLKQYRRVY